MIHVLGETFCYGFYLPVSYDAGCNDTGKRRHWLVLTFVVVSRKEVVCSVLSSQLIVTTGHHLLHIQGYNNRDFILKSFP